MIINYSANCCCNGSGVCQICCKPPSSITTQDGVLNYVCSGFHNGGDSQHLSMDGISNAQTHWYGTASTSQYSPIDGAYPWATLTYHCPNKWVGIQRTVGGQPRYVKQGQVTYPVNITCSDGFIPTYGDSRISWTRGTTVVNQQICCQPPQQVTANSQTFAFNTYQIIGSNVQFYYGIATDTKYPVTILYKCSDDNPRLFYNIPGSQQIAQISIKCIAGAMDKYISTSQFSFAAQISWGGGGVVANETNNFCCKTCAVPPASINGLPFFRTWYQLGSGSDLTNARLQHGTIIYAYWNGQYDWILIHKRCNLGIFQSSDIIQTYSQNPAFSYVDRVQSTGYFCKVLGMYVNSSFGITCDDSFLFERVILTDTYGQPSILGHTMSYIKYLNTNSGYFPAYSQGGISWQQAPDQSHLDDQYFSHCGA